MSRYEKVYIAFSSRDQAGDASRAQRAIKAAADRICEEFGTKVNMGITRHDMPAGGCVPGWDILCFDADLPVGSAQRAAEICAELTDEMDGDAEPGTCVLAVPMEDPEDGLHEDIASHADRKRREQIRKDHVELIRFGQQARLRQVTADEAREAAGKFAGLFLEGPSEEGMIGALAGVGLRISGENGRFLGTYDLTNFSSRKFGAVAQCIGGFRMNYKIDPNFADRTGGALGFHDRIRLIDNVTAVLSGGRFTLLCTYDNDELWTPYTEEDFGKTKKRRSCDYFELDPDEEERFMSTKRRSCGSCLFRKLTSEGFVCTAGHEPVR